MERLYSRPLRLVALALVCLFLTGCPQEIKRGLTEAEADEILVLLEQRGGIAGEKQSLGEKGWAVLVPSDATAAALKLLDEFNLPRKAYPGINDLFPPGELIPTAKTERARYMLALQGELANTLMRIDGIVDARVHVSLPEPDPLADPSKPAPRPRASVLIKYVTGARPEPGNIRSLVAHAIEGMVEDDVSVVLTEVRALAPTTDAGPQPVQVLGVGVMPDDAGRFRVLIGAAASIVLLAALGLVWAAYQMANARREAARLHAEREALRARLGRYLKQ